MTLQALPPVQPDHPLATGLVEDDGQCADGHDGVADHRSECGGQPDPRHRSGESQTGLQAPLPGHADQPADRVVLLAVGDLHAYQSSRSCSGRSPSNLSTR